MTDIKHENFQVEDPEARKLLNQFGDKLAKDLPEGHGFIFFLITGGEYPNLLYITTEERSYAIEVVSEWVRRNTQ